MEARTGFCQRSCRAIRCWELKKRPLAASRNGSKRLENEDHAYAEVTLLSRPYREAAEHLVGRSHVANA
jgi:hypothetical protein